MSKPATPVETPANEPVTDEVVASPTTESPRDTNDDVFLDDDDEEIDIDSIQVDTYVLLVQLSRASLTLNYADLISPTTLSSFYPVSDA